MKRHKKLRLLLALTLFIGSALSLISCDGGDDGPNAVNTQTISGTAVKGPVSGATVTAYALDNGTVGAPLGSTTTDDQGNFIIPMNSYSGPVMLQMTGGIYTDEATNTSMTMHVGDMMTSVIPSVSAGTTLNGIMITPLTSMAQARAHNMTGGMTAENAIAANTAVGVYFMVDDILITPPMNPLAAGSGAGADPDMRNYGMTIAAMSQQANTLGMPVSSGIITALMADATDGNMDGMMGTTPIATNGMGGMMGGGNLQPATGTSDLAAAMTTFMNNPAVNRSGLTTTDMQALIDRLNLTIGQLPGAGGASLNGLVSGTAMMGPVSGGTVDAFAINNGIISAKVASASIDNLGNFTLPMGAYSGPVMLQTSLGLYTDMATGTVMTMAPGDVMTTLIPALTAGSTISGIQITPITSMAQARAQNMPDGMTAENITAAHTAVGNYFSVGDILFTQPMDPMVNGAGATATLDMRNYGMAIAAMSQYANTLGMPVSSGIVTALMRDAADGIMNGRMGDSPIQMSGMGGMMGSGNLPPTAGTSDLAAAMTTFINNLVVNQSGLTTTDMQALITRMNNSTGIIE